MTSTLEAALAKLAALAPDDQDRVAQWLLDELADDEQWGRQFESSAGALTTLVGEARDDRTAGRTTALDHTKL